MSSIKKIFGHAAIYGLSSILGRFLNYLLVPIYTRVFLPNEFGVVTELYAYIVFVQILLTYGMETGFFNFSQNEKHKDSIYGTTLTSLFVTSSLFVVFMWFFSSKIATLLEYQNHTEYILWFAIIVAIDAFTSIPFAKLRQQNKAIKFATIKVVNILINIVLTLVFLLLIPYLVKQGNHELLAKWFIRPDMVRYVFIANLIASFATLFMFIPDLFKEKITFKFDTLKVVLLYSAPLLIAGLAGSVNEVLDRILQKYCTVVPHGTANPNEYIMSQIGIYGANFRLSVMIQLFIQAFRYSFEPFFFSHSGSGGKTKVYADVMKYFVVFCLLMFLGIVLYIDIIKYFIGNKYYEGLSIVPIILIANIFLGIMFNLSVWYKVTNKTSWGAYITIIGSVITIVLNIILIPMFSYVGSAWARLACYVSMCAISYFVGQRIYKIEYDLKIIGLYFGLALAIYFISIFLPFGSIYIKMFFNTVMLCSFIAFIAKKEKVLSLINKRNDN